MVRCLCYNQTAQPTRKFGSHMGTMHETTRKDIFCLQKVLFLLSINGKFVGCKTRHKFADFVRRLAAEEMLPAIGGAAKKSPRLSSLVIIQFCTGRIYVRMFCAHEKCIVLSNLQVYKYETVSKASHITAEPCSYDFAFFFFIFYSRFFLSIILSLFCY